MSPVTTPFELWALLHSEIIMVSAIGNASRFIHSTFYIYIWPDDEK